MLDAGTRAYWDKLNIIGRPRYAYFTNGFYRHGMLGRFIGLAHLLGIPPQRALLGADAPLNEVLHERLLRLVNGHPNETYFAWQALHRSYPGREIRACHPICNAASSNACATAPG